MFFNTRLFIEYSFWVFDDMIRLPCSQHSIAESFMTKKLFSRLLEFIHISNHINRMINYLSIVAVERI